MVSCWHLPYFSSCLTITLQSHSRFLSSRKEQNSSRVRIQTWMHLYLRNDECASRVFWFGSMQADISYKTSWWDGKKSPFTVIRYQIYIEHVSLKLSTLAFRRISHWIFPHINTFAYLKGKSCMTFTDIHCCKGPLLISGLWCKDQRFPHMLWYLSSTALTPCINTEHYNTKNSHTLSD